MSRDELSARALAELEALDAILARGPVAEEHLELAALVDSVRANAPAIDAAYAASLADRFASRRRRRPRRAFSGQWAFAGGGVVVAAAVAATILLSGSVRHDLFGGGVATPATPLLKHTPATAEPAIRTSQPRAAAGANSGASAAAPAPGPLAPFGTDHRLVAKGSSLTLATPPSQISSLAGEIVSATEAQGGVVEHSSVNVNGGASSFANFTLTVPSGRLGRLIAALSALAGVRSLNQSTQDITSPYRSETALLARRQAQLRSLRAQLAVAPSATAAASLRRQIGAVSHRISIERATIARLAGEASNATLSVAVVAGAAKKHGAVAPGALTRGYHDALHALQDILAIALIVLAIVLPFALCGLLVWWAAWSVRRRARERAIRAV